MLAIPEAEIVASRSGQTEWRDFLKDDPKGLVAYVTHCVVAMDGVGETPQRHLLRGDVKLALDLLGRLYRLVEGYGLREIDMRSEPITETMGECRAILSRLP